MKNTNKKIIVPYLYSCANIVTDANKEFIDFTGYAINELVGKTLHEIGYLLKLNSQIFLDKINNKHSVYIFTKSLNSLQVDISTLQVSEKDEKVYTFVEKPSSRLNDKLIFVEQTFIDNISGVAVYSVPDLILLKANEKYLTFTCSHFHRKEDSIGRPISEIITGFSGTQAEVIFNTVLVSQKAGYVKESEFDDFEKGKTYWDSTQTPIFENGKMKYIFHTAIEVTQRVLKNQNLEKQNKIIKQQSELAAVIENISDGISICDNSGKYIIYNKSAREMYFPSCEYISTTSYGYNQPEFYNTNGEKIDSDDIPSRRVIRGEKFKNVRMSIKLPFKTLEIDVSGTPIYDSEGKFILGVISCRDITDDCMHEQAIKRRFEILNRVVNTFDLPVVRLSCPDLKIIDINKKALNTIKLIRPDLIPGERIKNNTIKDLFGTPSTAEYYRCISEVLKEKKTKYLNKEYYIINGNELYFNVIFEPVLEVNGEIQEILILIIDVTSEIKSNIVMKKALKLQGEFLVNISHELKTPLNVISATAQLFNMYCESGSLDAKKPSIIKYIDSIKQNSYRLSKMINNIVDLSKIEAGFFKLNLSNNNIVEFVENIVMSITNLTDSKGLNIIFDTNTEEKIIACDPAKVERVILNLISNAIKFSDVGDEIFVNVKDKNKFVEISVSDNGIGIEEKDLDMIFDRFKQVDKSLSRNSEGTGIGLSLVKSIVELHGGNITVESQLGKGSTFTVILPSEKVLHQSKLYNSEVRSGDQSIRVELSDVYS